MSVMKTVFGVLLVLFCVSITCASDITPMAPLVPVVGWSCGGASAMPGEPQAPGIVIQAPGVDLAVGGAGGGYVLPYRNDQAGKEAATAEVARALLEATRRNGEALQEILRLQREGAAAPGATAPPVIVAPPIVEEKPSLGERIHDRVEARKDAVADFVDNLTDSPFARRALILAVIFGVIWFSIKKHKKDGTPTHIERATEAIKNATSGIPILGQVTSVVDKISDSAGDKIRDLQDKLAAKHAEAEAKKSELAAQKELTKVALATPAPSQVA